MDSEDYMKGLRVTRARTRHFSVDSRPTTPHSDIVPERVGSPRTTRRTRLTVIDPATPIRTTRSSVARGETPEPTTPVVSSAVKRANKRTPNVRSARKKLPLQENIDEETENVMKIDQGTLESNSLGGNSSDERSTPPRPISSPVDQKRVTRSSISPKLVETKPQKEESVSLTKQKQSTAKLDISQAINLSASQLKVRLKSITIKQNSLKDETEETAKEKAAMEMVDISIPIKVEKESPERVDAPISDVAVDSSIVIIDESMEFAQETVELPASPAAVNDAPEKSLIEIAIRDENENDYLQQSVEVVSPHGLEPQSNRKSSGGKVVEVLELPNLTPGLKSRVVGHQTSESDNVDEVMGSPLSKPQNTSQAIDQPGSKTDDPAEQLEPTKLVKFQINTMDEGDELKSTYPKTPARGKAPPIASFAELLQSGKAKTATPYKPKVQQGRDSSTPIPKADLSVSKPQPAPLQIDTIQPLADINSNANEEILTPAKPMMRRALLAEAEDSEDEDDSVGERNEFIDDEALEVENYQSGDSMDSSERREVEENELPHDGESVGSQDTVDEYSDDDYDHDDSFLESDNAEDSEELPSCSSGKGKRLRIVVADDSSESELPPDEPSPSEASQVLNGSTGEQSDSSMDETEVESSRKAILRQINQSDRFNKTTSQLDVSGSEESFDGTEGAKKNRKMPTLALEASDEEPNAAVAVKASTTKAFHEMQNREDEEELLAELPNCDLTHLQPLFNPLQKARRQTLYSVADAAAVLNKSPKLKRRSEVLSSNDFNPSQSFTETLSERQQSKRKRLSKSFCGAAVELEAVADYAVNENKNGNGPGKPVDAVATADSEQPMVEVMAGASDDLAENNTSVNGLDEPMVAVATSDCGQSMAKVLATNDVWAEEQHGDKKSASEPDEPMESVEQPAAKVASDEPETKQAVQEKPKNWLHYVNYCDDLMQAANLAKLEQKKQHIAAGSNKKRPSAVAAKLAEPQAANRDANALQPKKKVKRLQATKQAVKQAMQLLVPAVPNNQPVSLARKLSPQPPNDVQSGGKRKQKKIVISPVKSSDDENRSRNMNCIKTSAGYVTISPPSPPSPPMELIKLPSGFMRVEPATPTSKHFREMSDSPVHNQRGFRELPAHKSKRRGNKPPSSATEAALRFKQQVFGWKH